jgi:hypothetical protein
MASADGEAGFKESNHKSEATGRPTCFGDDRRSEAKRPELSPDQEGKWAAARRSAPTARILVEPPGRTAQSGL